MDLIWLLTCAVALIVLFELCDSGPRYPQL